MSTYVRAYEGNDPYIFVSYAHKDSERVLPVIHQLYERKYRVWYDEGIKPGSEWPKNIAIHLQKAAAVLVFVSKNSLASPNCKNEISRAPKDKKMILVSIDGVISDSLFFKEDKYKLGDELLSRMKELTIFDLGDDLIDRLTDNIDPSFIGDGVSGYEYSIDKKRSFNTWNILLGLAAALAVVFAVSLYGLYSGWFDPLLPARQPAAEVIAPTEEPQDVISVGNNLLGSVLPVKFSSEKEKNAVYEIFGWSQPYEMTYKDLVEMEGLTDLELCSQWISDITFAAYLPDLERLRICCPQLTDLSPLIECPNLKTVQITMDMLPVTLPPDRSFEVEIK